MRQVLGSLVGRRVVVVVNGDVALVGTLARRHGGQGGRYIILTGRRGRPVTVRPSEVVAAFPLPVEDAQDEAEARAEVSA